MESDYEKIQKEIKDALPELNEIKNENLRDKVIKVWVKSYSISDFESLDQLHFGGIEGESQVKHTRDVTKCAIALTDTLLNSRNSSLDRDLVVAGALLHDISKFQENSPKGKTNIAKKLHHPHYAIYLLEDAGIPLDVQHTVLVHSSKSGPKPNSLEAHIVMLADLAAANSIFWDNTDDFGMRIEIEEV